MQNMLCNFVVLYGPLPSYHSYQDSSKSDLTSEKKDFK